MAQFNAFQHISSDVAWAPQGKSAQLFLAQLEAPWCDGEILS
jgi:hypothetical protein